MTEQNSPWPAGSMIQGINFAKPGAGFEVVAPDGPAHCYLLTLSDPDSSHEQSIRGWLMPDGKELTGYQLVTLQGVQIHWCLPRLAIIAEPTRIESIRAAALESAYLELELRSVEDKLAQLWPELELDAPLAFAFQERDMRRHKQLAERFLQLMLLRSRLARITPRLMIPQTYPPTLSSQVSERLRERLGVTYRVESLEKQLEMFERIYDGCGQRASDYVQTRQGLTLEWFIILLLLTQTIIVVVELLTKA